MAFVPCPNCSQVMNFYIIFKATTLFHCILHKYNFTKWNKKFKNSISLEKKENFKNQKVTVMDVDLYILQERI
jgi:hypothetical protein